MKKRALTLREFEEEVWMEESGHGLSIPASAVKSAWKAGRTPQWLVTKYARKEGLLP